MFGDRPQDRPNVQLEREFDRPLSPKERAAVAKAVKIASGGAAARNRKERARQQLAAKIRSGEYVSPADLKKAQAAGVNFGTHGLVGKTVKGLAESAEYALPGLYETGKAAALDTRDIARAIGGREGGDLTPSRSAKIAKAVGEGVGESFAHPGRHPDQTILNVLAALSLGAGTAARLGAAGAAAREGGLGAALARPGYEGGSLLRKPVPPIRKVRVGDTEFQGTYSKNAARQMVQQAMDRRAERRAAAGKPEALNTQAGRYGARQRMIEEDAARSSEMTVRQAGRKLTPGQHMAVRAVVEQTPLSDRLALAQSELAKAAKPRDRARLKREIGLIRAAEPYVKVADDGKVAIADFKTPRKRSKRRAASPEALRVQVDRIVKGGKRREAQGQELGLLEPETITERAARPQQIAAEAAGTEPTASPLGYLGYGNRRARDVVFRPFASRTGARPKPTPELAASLKEFTGRNQRVANYEHDTSRVAATGMAAMNRLHMSVRTNDRLFAAGVPARPVDTLRTKWVPVRDRDLSPGAMATLRSLTEKIEGDQPLTGAERQAFQRAMEEIQPKVDAEALSADVGTQIGGVHWVPRAVFDRVTQVGQPASVPTHWTGRALQTAWREFNSGLRGVVLYGKGLGAAYITPNLAANVLLLGFQGGPKAVPALMKALNPKFRKAVGEDAWNAGKARMGEGFMTSTFAERAGRGPVAATMQAWSKALGKVTDEQTRMASLIMEAAGRGYKTPQQFRSLMLDPKHADDAMDVTIRARDAALDYGLMTPAERSYVASWLFVYPFMRAAARYTVNFPLDHPYQAAVYAQLAQIAMGQENLGDRGIGPDAGLVQTGTRDVPGVGNLPVVRNVNSLSPFTTMQEMGQTLGAFFGLPVGNTEGRGPLDLASPAVTSAFETISGVDSFTGRPVERNIKGFAGQVASNIPTVQDIQQVQKSPEEKARQVSPKSVRDVIERQFEGSLASKPYNVAKAQEYRQRDRNAGKPAPVRARIRVFNERQKVFQTMKAKDPQLLRGGRLPAPVRRAYNRAADVEAARAAARESSGGDSLAYYRDVAYREARLYEKWGAAPRGFAADVKRSVSALSLDELRAGVRKMRDDIAPDSYRDITGEGRKYLERRAS